MIIFIASVVDLVITYDTKKSSFRANISLYLFTYFLTSFFIDLFDKFNCSMVLSYRLLLIIIFLFNLFAKMNLTSAIKLEQVEKAIEENQRFMTKWIDDYEYKVRGLENFINILYNTRNQNVTKLERETKSV